jgi:predicted peptidase
MFGQMYILFILLFGIADLFPDDALIKRFQDLQYQTDSSTDAPVTRYRLYVPPEINPGEQIPLLLWLHGAGDQADTNIPNLKFMPMLFDVLHDKPPMIIVVPQLKPNQAWNSLKLGPNDALSACENLLTQKMAQYPIDANRVYLVGVSSGGNACWEMVRRYPEQFAAVTILSSRGGNPTQARFLTKTPIWVFHCHTDTIVPPEGDREMVEAVKEAGGIIKLTETELDDRNFDVHDSWTGAIYEYQMFDWLLAQRRSVPTVWLPDHTTPQSSHKFSGQLMVIAQNYWPHALIVVIAFFGFLAWQRNTKRKSSDKRRRPAIENASTNGGQRTPGK